MKLGMRPFVLLAVLFCGLVHAQAGESPSIRDTVTNVIERMRTEVPAEKLTSLNPEQALDLLKDNEKEVLSTEYLTFRVNTSVVVTVLRESAQPEVPFWLKSRGFEKGTDEVRVGRDVYEPWSRKFDAGVIGLGVNSLSGAGSHYFVAVAPAISEVKVIMTDVAPARHTLGILEKGAHPYVESRATITELPASLTGQGLIRGDQSRRREAQITGIFKSTEYPSSPTPDDVALTWSDDPRTTQSIQWRTNLDTARGVVRYQRKPASGGANAAAWETVEGRTERLENNILVNDPVCNRHTAVLRNLDPGTAYLYAVGDGSDTGWTQPGEFSTAPTGTESFKFIYMGDAQSGLDTWGKLLHHAFETEQDAAFYLMAGDQVNRGNERNEWDSFFHNSEGVYDRRPVVPSVGNHECQGELGPWMYLDVFDLPKNGPRTVPPERSYAFEYSNALFVMLDSNLPPTDQSAWLEETLGKTKATWRFVAFHHPVYSSAVTRDNPEVRTLWGSLFDKYHVDLVLQGHDHAYLRTYPMYDEKRVASPAEGTIYIVSNSGQKLYEQGQHDYTQVGFANLSLYQVIAIDAETNTLNYKACDADGKVWDEFVITK